MARSSPILFIPAKKLRAPSVSSVFSVVLPVVPFRVFALSCFAFSIPSGDPLLIRRAGALEGGLGGGEAGDRDAERGAAHVVEADLVAEGDAVRVAAVLA